MGRWVFREIGGARARAFGGVDGWMDAWLGGSCVWIRTCVNCAWGGVRNLVWVVGGGVCVHGCRFERC